MNHDLPDEADLVEFFGILPEPEPAEEREFFGAPSFRKSMGELTLEFSLSAHFKDLYLTLRHAAHEAPVLECVLHGVLRASVDRTDPARPWLRVLSATQGRVELSVEPTIAIQIRADGFSV